MKYLFLLILMGAFLISCDDEEKVTKLYAYPEWQKDKFYKLKPGKQQFFLFHFGALPSNLLPKKELKSPTLPKSMPHDFNIGGAAVLTSYLKIIKERFQEDAVFLSHGGLSYYKKDKIKKELISKTMKGIPIDALILSKRDILSPQSSKQNDFDHLPWFNSNILSIKTGEPTDLYKSEPFKIITRPNLKIGLIGTTSYKLLSPVERNEISGFYFQDPVTTILRTKNQLKKADVDLVALYYEGPLECKQDPLTHHVAFKDLPKLEDVCEKESELLETLKRLPPDSLDMVLTSSPNFSGLRHQNLPILGLKSPELFIQGIKVSFSNKKLDLKNSFLLEPVKLCHQVFVATQDCVYDLNDQDLNEERFDLMEKSSFALINARFLGHEVNEDESILKVINDR